MGYLLRPGVSFCEIEGSAIFLDLARDRYFCLGERASAAFFDLVHTPTTAVTPDWPAYGLVLQGALSPTTSIEAPIACTAKPVLGSLLMPTSKTGSIADTTEALLNRLTAEFSVKVCGLASRVKAAERRRLYHAKRIDRDLAVRASKAFAAAALWRSRQQRCLSISIATVSWLARRGCWADLLFGVRLHPFQAHCWVQCDGFLVNDPVDAVRNFTPILVV